MRKEFTVTEKAQRPAGKNGECYYCQQKIGCLHKIDCVLMQKKVEIEMTITYEVGVPASWEKEEIEAHRNESSWCVDNAIDELQKFKGEDCLCGYASFKYVKDISSPYLEEG